MGETRLRRIDPLYALALLLFVATVAFSVVTAGGRDETGIARSASVFDQGPGGAALLRRYFESLGAQTVIVAGDRFSPASSGAAVLFVLGASDPFTPADVAAVREFVSRGGTLVLATDAGIAEALLLDALDVELRSFAQPGRHEVRGIALAAAPSARLEVDRARELDLGERGQPVAASARAPVAAVVREGQGAAFVVGSLGPFLSAQLGNADNGAFAMALADLAFRSGRPIAFDEYHHGVRPGPDALAVMWGTWPGRALLVATVMVFAYLILTARRLGPPIPLDPRPPRSSLEYVRGFAGLVRRSGHREIAVERLRRELHSGLARELGVDPRTPFERITANIAADDPARAAEARSLDAALAGRLRDRDLLHTVARVERLLDRRPALFAASPSRPHGTSASQIAVRRTR